MFVEPSVNEEDAEWEGVEETEISKEYIELERQDQQIAQENTKSIEEQDPYQTKRSSMPTTSISARSQRQRKRTPAMQEAIDQGLNITSFKSTIEDHEEYYEVLHQDDYLLQDQMLDPIAFKASSDRDTMYYHQAMNAPDKDQFIDAIVKEINAHIDGNHWELIPADKVPKGVKVLDSVWSMKRKRDIKTREVYKHKARLNIHGGQQEYGLHYTETYSPVVQWFTVRLILILAKLNNYHTKQIDFILAYPQADIPFDNYMKLPKGVSTVKGDRNSQVLKLKKNIYGGKNSGRIWYDYLVKGLTNIGFEQSTSNECLFFRDDTMFFFYVDDGIFVSKNKVSIDKALADLKNPKKAKRSFNIDDQGDITDYLGINFDVLEDGRLKLWQPHLIDQILEEVGINPREKVKSTPAASTKILKRCKDDPPAKVKFNYRKVIGKLNYLEKSSRP